MRMGCRNGASTPDGGVTVGSTVACAWPAASRQPTGAAAAPVFPCGSATTRWPTVPWQARCRTTPGVVLDPFGGTGTTALVAKVLGREGISVDMSADYCRLARWRTTDSDQIASAMQVDKPAKQVEGQWDLFDLDVIA